MPQEIRLTREFYKEKILKIKEDHTANRHLALVIGNVGGPRWIPASESMQEGQVVKTDLTGRDLEVTEIQEGNSYKVVSLPVGTKICHIEKMPGMGTTLAHTSGRYGIITGRLRRFAENGTEIKPMVMVSFPYASPEGYTMEVDGEEKNFNNKGIVNKIGTFP